MAVVTLISMSESYLATTYRPDCDYVDGEGRREAVLRMDYLYKDDHYPRFLL